MKFHPLLRTAAAAFALLSAPLLAAENPAAPATPAAPDAATVFEPTNLDGLRAVVGQTVTVEGTPVGTGASKSGTVRYLNFTKNFRESVALVFFVSKGGDAFSAEKLGEWVAKKIRATGKLTEFNGALQIEIEKVEQIVEVP